MFTPKYIPGLLLSVLLLGCDRSSPIQNNKEETLTERPSTQKVNQFANLCNFETFKLLINCNVEKRLDTIYQLSFQKKFSNAIQVITIYTTEKSSYLNLYYTFIHSTFTKPNEINSKEFDGIEKYLHVGLEDTLYIRYKNPKMHRVSKSEISQSIFFLNEKFWSIPETGNKDLIDTAILTIEGLRNGEFKTIWRADFKDGDTYKSILPILDAIDLKIYD